MAQVEGLNLRGLSLLRPHPTCPRIQRVFPKGAVDSRSRSCTKALLIWPAPRVVACTATSDRDTSSYKTSEVEPWGRCARSAGRKTARRRCFAKAAVQRWPPRRAQLQLTGRRRTARTVQRPTRRAPDSASPAAVLCCRHHHLLHPFRSWQLQPMSMVVRCSNPRLARRAWEAGSSRWWDSCWQPLH